MKVRSLENVTKVTFVDVTVKQMKFYDKKLIGSESKSQNNIMVWYHTRYSMEGCQSNPSNKQSSSKSVIEMNLLLYLYCSRKAQTDIVYNTVPYHISIGTIIFTLLDILHCCSSDGHF